MCVCEAKSHSTYVWSKTKRCYESKEIEKKEGVLGLPADVFVRDVSIKKKIFRYLLKHLSSLFG